MTTADLPVSVVILTYNSAPYLPVCLEELSHSRGIDLEVVVVDNSSSDESAAIAAGHPVVNKAIPLQENLGCAGGNNVGWKAASHPFVVFLNADCAVEPRALRGLVLPLAEDPSLGATGGKLYYPNSSIIQHAGGRIHPNAMAEHDGMGEGDEGQFDRRREVDYVTGALLAVRFEDLQALGGLDEEFFPAYYEESDLCYRLRSSGKRVLFIPEAVGYHWESAGLGIASPRLVRMSYRARMIYVVKNHSLATFFREFLPFEWKWFWSSFARGFRGAVLRSYLSGALFALKCLARMHRRPRSIRKRLLSS